MGPTRKRSRRTPPPLALAPTLAAAVGVAAAAAALVRRRRSGSASPQQATAHATPDDHAAAALAVAPDTPVTQTVEHEWQCRCGQDFRVSGEGRHRVYWLPDATAADPVMDGRCPNCGRELPGEQAEAEAEAEAEA